VIHPGLVNTPMTRAAGWSSTEELKLLDPEDVARAAAFVLAQPPHVNITELVIRPSNQPM
jgi:NADP-dependent 3-hydroxy acid dehydrogenase YdfG